MAIPVRTALGAAALACLCASAHAEVLTFEDRPAGQQFFLSDYNGFRFGTNNIQTTDWFSTDEVSIYYIPVSGTHFVAVDYGNYPATLPLTPAQSITRSVDFKFDGAWFTGGDSVQYRLYNNGALVFTSAISAELTNVPLFVSSGYTGMVDEVVILGTQGFYALDDFTYNTPEVPEPGTYGLLAAGLAAVGIMVRRRQHG